VQTFRAQILFTLAAACLFATAAGCGGDEILSKEVKRLDEPVTSAELSSFFAIIEDMPDKKLPPLPPLMPPPPQWSAARTRPVSELVHEDQKTAKDYASVPKLVKALAQSRTLKASLRRERMTPEQFAGLILTIGTALSRDEVPEDIDLDTVLTRGRRVIAELEKDASIYSSLKEDRAYYILEQAAWVPLYELGQRLRLVPTENRDLIRRHREQVVAVFPEEFRKNPLTGFAKLLEDQGTPFEELPESGSDDHIAWPREQAIVGKDEG